MNNNCTHIYQIFIKNNISKTIDYGSMWTCKDCKTDIKVGIQYVEPNKEQTLIRKFINNGYYYRYVDNNDLEWKPEYE